MTEESIALEHLAKLLVDFLPGPGPGYPVVPNSFLGIARELGLSQHWRGSQKVQLINSLLVGCKETAPDKFCRLVYEIVDRCKQQRSGGKNTLSKHELAEVLQCLDKLKAKIPELESEEFQKDLSGGQDWSKATQALEKHSASDLFSRLRKEIISINLLPPEEKGYALELFLNKFFANQDLSPRSPFRQNNNEITGIVKTKQGSFALHAFWLRESMEQDLPLILEQMDKEHTCLLISILPYTDEFRGSFSAGERLVAVDLRDLFFILDGGANLEQMLFLKKQAAGKGNSFALIQDLLWGA